MRQLLFCKLNVDYEKKAEAKIKGPLLLHNTTLRVYFQSVFFTGLFLKPVTFTYKQQLWQQIK
jgi:hypothetical protein